MGGHKTSKSDEAGCCDTEAVVLRALRLPGVVSCALRTVAVETGDLRVLAVAGPGAAGLAKAPAAGLLRQDAADGVDVILPVTDVHGDTAFDAPIWTDASQEAALRDLEARFDTADVALTLDWDVAPVARARVGTAEAATAELLVTDRTTFGQQLSDQPAIIEGAPFVAPDDYPHTLADAVSRRAASTKEIVAYRPDGQVVRMSYAQLVDQARRVQAALTEKGLGKGDIVLCDVTDAVQSTAVIWGATLAGVVPALITVPADRSEGQADAYARIKAAAQVLGHPPIILDQTRVTDALGGLKPLDAAALVQHDKVAETPAAIDPEDDAVILLTSGSTGVPKGVVQSHRAVLAMVGAALHRGAGIESRHAIFNWMPRDHVGSYMIATLGGCVLDASQVHADTAWVLADPTRWLDAMSDHRAGLTWSPNFSFALITQAAAASHGAWDLSGLRAIFNGGETVTEDVLDAFIAAMEPFGVTGTEVMIPSLGMSETCSAVTLGRLGQARGPFTSLGGAVPGTRLRAVDTSGHVLREGEIGHVQVTGPQLLSRYHGLDRPAVSKDGWYDTGDLGFVAGGSLYLTGRLKDTVNVNGATYFAHEIEQALSGIPGLDDSATVVTAIERPGHESEALAVVFAPAQANDLRDATVLAHLAAAVRDRLAARLSLMPDLLIPIHPLDIPRTSIGKVVRRTLQDQYAAGLFDSRIAQLEHAVGAPGVVPFAAHRRVWTPVTVRIDPAEQPALVLCDDTDTALFRDAVPATDIVPLDVPLPPERVQGRKIIFVAPATGTAAPAYVALARLADRIAAMPAARRPAQVCVVTARALSVAEGDPMSERHALLPGLVRALGVSAADVHWSLVDVAKEDRAAHRDAICASRHVTAALRGGTWLVPQWRAEPVERQDFSTSAGLWVVTGGLGGIGRQICAALQAEGATLIIVGRTPEMALDPVRVQALSELRVNGTVRYVVCDMADASLGAHIAEVERDMAQPVLGVLHLAAVVPDEEAHSSVEAVWADAQAGLVAVCALAAERPRLRLVTVGSIVGQVGGRLRAYAAINAACAELSVSTQGLDHVRLDLSCWENRGMSEGRTSASLLHADGVLPLGDAAGLLLVRHAMTAPAGHVIAGMDTRHPRHGYLEASADARAVLAPAAWVGGAASMGVTGLHDARGAVRSVPVNVLPALPRAADGTVDHDQLAAGSADAAVDTSDPVLHVVALAMADTLHLDEPPVSADFFSLGGTSLQAARLAQQLSELFFVPLGISHVFRAPRPAQMAVTLRDNEAEPGLVDAAAAEILNVLKTPQDQVEPAE